MFLGDKGVTDIDQSIVARLKKISAAVGFNESREFRVLCRRYRITRVYAVLLSFIASGIKLGAEHYDDRRFCARSIDRSECALPSSPPSFG